MKIEGVMGGLSIAAGLFGFGPLLLCTEGLTDTEILTAQAGFAATLLAGVALLHLSRFNTEEDRTVAI